MMKSKGHQGISFLWRNTYVGTTGCILVETILISILPLQPLCTVPSWSCHLIARISPSHPPSTWLPGASKHNNTPELILWQYIPQVIKKEMLKPYLKILRLSHTYDNFQWCTTCSHALLNVNDDWNIYCLWCTIWHIPFRWFNVAQ